MPTDDDDDGYSALFEEVSQLIRDAKVTPETKVNDVVKLRLYGLFKQASVGVCSEEDLPSIFQPIARAKFEAWSSCKSMTQEEARQAYVELAAEQDNPVGQQCKEMLAKHLESRESNQSSETKAKDAKLPSPEPLMETLPRKVQDEAPGMKRTTLEKWTGVSEMVPRGQLDISFADLTFAAKECLHSNNVCRCSSLEKEIEGLWEEDGNTEAMVGWSVRTLFDLFLRSRAYPSDSEVIVSPPITIPDMVKIMQGHRLKVIPIDLPDKSSIQVDVESIEAAVTEKTVAIMVVHPFGMVSASHDQMKAIGDLAKKHELDVVEDCAECFVGLGSQCFKGSEHAHLSLFSFGTIKTATALGGAVGLLRGCGELGTKMRRMQNSLYDEQQTHWEYSRKILKCGFLKLISQLPIVYGFAYLLCTWVGIDFDYLVTSLIRNIPSSDFDLKRFRRRPSAALLMVLKRRLLQSASYAASFQARSRRCRKMRQLLQNSSVATMPLPPPNHQDTHWLFPIQVEPTTAAIRQLRKRGFDAARKATQLSCISTMRGIQASCPRARKMMATILYLPVSSSNVSFDQMKALHIALQQLAGSRGNDDFRLPWPCWKPPATNKLLRWTVALVALLVDQCVISFIPGSETLIHLVRNGVLIAVAFFVLPLAFATFARWRMAKFYISRSNTFAKYNSMLRMQRRDETDNHSSVPPGFSLADLNLVPSTSHEKTRILLTGATGFLGSMILRELLKQKEQIRLSGVVLLCRSKRGKSACERVKKFLSRPMFSFLSNSEKETLVSVIEGDVSQPNAGIGEEDMVNLLLDGSVTHVIHCAASVSFTQSLDEAAHANITPSLTLQTLAKTLRHNCTYVHVSTAFVHGGNSGTRERPLSEELFDLGPYDAFKIYSSMLNTNFYATTAMNDLAFPNTYTFSKCVCEHLLVREDGVRTVIVRPSIVGPAVEEPFEGWCGNKPSTVVAAACLYLKYQWNLWCFANQSVPYIPIDVAAKYIVCKSFVTEGESTDDGGTSSMGDDFERVAEESETSSDSAVLVSEVPTEGAHIIVHNVAWDRVSAPTAFFSWLDYAVAVTQTGSVSESFCRATAFVGLFVTVYLLPAIGPSLSAFKRLHNYIVVLPIEVTLTIADRLKLRSSTIEGLRRLQGYLDLPVLFFPFMNQTYFFASELAATESLCGQRYAFSCAAAAHALVSGIASFPAAQDRSTKDLRSLTVAGNMHQPATSDLWWALTQPTGNVFIRLAGWVFIKILRRCSASVTVDVESFADAARHFTDHCDGQRPHVILAPSHRSLFDFILVSFVLFSLPELQLDLPFIAAADDFSGLPFFGWFARKALAFFVKRGRGHADPKLNTRVASLKRAAGEKGACIEVYIEGTRSRDRRFLKPKTGFLRCLVETDGNHCIVPLCINYERVPELTALTSNGGNQLSVNGLYGWLKDVFHGRIAIGRIHVAASAPIKMNSNTALQDMEDIAAEIQGEQQKQVRFSEYHSTAIANVLGLEEQIVRDALLRLGCKPFPHLDYGASVPNSSTDGWHCLFRVGYLVAPLLQDQHPDWSTWIDPTSSPSTSRSQCDSDSVRLIQQSISRNIVTAEDAIKEVQLLLQQKGYTKPKAEHLLQTLLDRGAFESSMMPLYKAAIQISLASRGDVESEAWPADVGSPLFGSQLEMRVPNTEEALGRWGFRSCRFTLQANKTGGSSVVMTGKKYAAGGRRVNKLIPFIEQETHTKINPSHEWHCEGKRLNPGKQQLSDEQLEELTKAVHRVDHDDVSRIRHGTGQTQNDMYLIRSRSSIRVPDVVAWPANEDEIESLVKLAERFQWCLIPHGGGTNVSHATRCPSREVEPRPIISVDMRQMKRVLWVNEEDGLAHVEAGITGRELVAEMRNRGFTVGHEPDSIEFSTLGGWIATKASGMKRGKYGNIEDIVVSVRVYGSHGQLQDESPFCDHIAFGRESKGLDLKSIMLGSEGCMGIIGSATIRIWALPELTSYQSVVFSDLEHGMRFVRAIARFGSNIPASVRLLDNEHFRLGRALQGDVSPLQKLFASYTFSRLKPDQVVCATLVYEGRKAEVREQRKQVKRLIEMHGGIALGSRVGRQGYELTFLVAYLRDFAMSYYFLGDSFEAFVPWSRVSSVIERTKARIRLEHKDRFLPGRPFVGARVTQLYHEGACVYFYFCMNFENVDKPSSVFMLIEAAARDEILKGGGCLSHHHGVGKIKAPLLKNFTAGAFQDGAVAMKQKIDPHNLFGARNGLFN